MPSEQVKHYSDGISFTWRGKVILPELLSDFSPVRMCPNVSLRTMSVKITVTFTFCKNVWKNYLR